MASVYATSPGALFALVRGGRAGSRADLARVTGLSASTVAQRVEELMTLGYLAESGRGASSGGRRPRLVEVSENNHAVVGVDLGEDALILALVSRSGAVVAETRAALVPGESPAEVVARAVVLAYELAAEHTRTLEGIALSVPGPVDASGERLISPIRMPGWNGVNVRALMQQHTELPVLVENDANAMALGEYLARDGVTEQLISVKAGTGIGAGIVIDGEVYRGFGGVAGDISHVAISAGESVLCSCGRSGCLDVVASGSAIVATLRAQGVMVSSLDEVMGLAGDAHPIAMGALREAGARLGTVLSTIINFFNPHALVLGGSLALADAFVAGVRQSIFTLCLPMSTDRLEISVARAGQVGSARGAAWELTERLLTEQSIDAAVHGHRVAL
ncbi:ROK family transcriptional regulator [Leucobacter sp. HY1908]